MALPSSGAISFNNVNQELGRASPYNQQVALNDSNVRTLFQRTGSATQISMSHGYGKSNVTIVTFSGGNSYSWTVPAGITSILVKAWGGGGGGGGPNGDGYGGAGGYFEGNISVSAGNTINISVPGVVSGDVDHQCYCDENGYTTNIMNNSGDGGEAAVVSYSTTSTYCIVGGGGGGANGDGGPGGSNGGNGYAAGDGGGSSPYGSGGGGSTSGGIGYCSGSVHSGTTPGSGCNNWNKGLVISCGGNSGYGGGGGRGGDGWAGGGSGYGQSAAGLACNQNTYPNGAGGGGGSTGWTGTGWSNTVSIRNTDVSYSGSRRVAPETGNVDYPGSNVAYGGNFGAFGGDGGPGYVVIRY